MIAAAAALAGVATGGCDFPRDPEGTLDRIRGGTMRVGVAESDPWVRLEGERPGGVEPRLIERLAGSLGARVEWIEGSESELVAALEERQLDLVIAGLTTESPWEKHAALTRPYVKTKLVVGLPPGTEARDDLSGLRVVAEDGGAAAGLVESRTEANVTRVDDIARARGRPAAVEEWLLDDLDLEPSGVELEEQRHIMATSPGENAWLLELERFLLERKDEVRRLIEEEGRP